jgi:hypothetical protein
MSKHIDLTVPRYGDLEMRTVYRESSVCVTTNRYNAEMVTRALVKKLGVPHNGGESLELLTNSIARSPTWEADSRSASQDIPRL